MKTIALLTACLLLNGCAGFNWQAFGNGLTQMSQNNPQPIAFYDANDRANDEQTNNRVQDALSPITGVGSVRVHGYYSSTSGRWIESYTRTAPDGIEENNMSH